VYNEKNGLVKIELALDQGVRSNMISEKQLKRREADRKIDRALKNY